MKVHHPTVAIALSLAKFTSFLWWLTRRDEAARWHRVDLGFAAEAHREAIR